jgi:hypothetical protein
VALCVDAVWMVSVSVIGPLPAVSVREGGTKVHVTFTGSVPHEKFTVPVYPPVGVTVMVSVPELPLATVRLAGLMEPVTPTVTTVSVSGLDTLPVIAPEPP